MKDPAAENPSCTVAEFDSSAFNKAGSKPLYGVYLFKGAGDIEVDFITYSFSGPTVLFSAPYQHVQIQSPASIQIRALSFHGDYYCIEYHKQEVACNGLLFNNIYNQPFVHLAEAAFQEISSLMDKLQQELTFSDNYSKAVAQTYLQLMLALSSKAKIAAQNLDLAGTSHHPILAFKALLETHFKDERSPAFYAQQLGLAVNTLSKQCKSQFHKTPSFLIQERVILEAKKLIHLTFRSMKEIAAELHFDDEHYFSRYFKKHTGISPTGFREQVGTSQVAYLSI